MKNLTSAQKTSLIKIIAAAALFAAGIAAEAAGLAILSLICLAAAYLLVGAEVLIDAVRGLIGGQLVDENFLMAIATIGAALLGEYTEGVAVMLFYQVGELFQSIAVERSRRSITALMDLAADYADVLRGGKLERVDPEEVQVDEIIVVRPGEKLPLDGVVTEGESSLDTSALTGESLPRSVAVGDEVLSGSINGEGQLHIRVTSAAHESTVARILDLVENSVAKKSKRERFITRFARVYTPVVVIAAVMLAVVPSLITGNWSKWVYQGLNFLVISCPCALVISVPLSFFGGIGAASKRGILVKGAGYFEVLAELDTVAFDKTGTITEGRFRVAEVHPVGISEAELLTLAAKAESASSHPIARSIAMAAGEPDASDVSDITELAGRGVRCKIGGETVLCGGERLLREVGIDCAPADYGTAVYVARSGKPLGVIIVADKIKASSREAVRRLRASGVRRLVMLTGDNEQTAARIASEAGIDEFRAGLLPGDKVTAVELLMSEGAAGKLAFVGDGINDAPVLSRADVGIAMGGIGSDAATAAADIVLMDDDPAKIADAVMIARRTIAISKQNTIFALAVKGLIMALGFIGAANMWLAVFADVGVSVIAICNAMRAQNAPALRKK